MKDPQSDINSLTVESNSLTLGCTISDSIQLDNQSSLFLTEDYAYIQRSLWPEINLSLGPDQFVACLDTIPLQVTIDSSVSQFEWISANPIADSSSLNTYAIINQSGNIIFSAQNGCGQTTADYILVEVLDSLGMFLDLGPDTIIQCNDSFLWFLI